jgi:hypothetical protein
MLRVVKGCLVLMAALVVVAVPVPVVFIYAAVLFVVPVVPIVHLDLKLSMLLWCLTMISTRPPLSPLRNNFSLELLLCPVPTLSQLLADILKPFQLCSHVIVSLLA